jgi:hypothetical protein
MKGKRLIVLAGLTVLDLYLLSVPVRAVIEGRGHSGVFWTAICLTILIFGLSVGVTYKVAAPLRAGGTGE